MKNNNIKLCVALICTFILLLQNNNSNATENKIFSIQSNNNLVMKNTIDNTNEVYNKIEDYAQFISEMPNNNNKVAENCIDDISMDKSDEIIVLDSYYASLLSDSALNSSISIQHDFWSNQKDNSYDENMELINTINKNDINIHFLTEYDLIVKELKMIIDNEQKTNANNKLQVNRPKAPKYEYYHENKLFNNIEEEKQTTQKLVYNKYNDTANYNITYSNCEIINSEQTPIMRPKAKRVFNRRNNVKIKTHLINDKFIKRKK